MAILYSSVKGSPLTSGEIDSNFLELENRLQPFERAIRVSGTGDESTALQTAIDAAGSHVAIIFDTPSCTLWGIDVTGKESVFIGVAQECRLKVPASAIDAHSANQADCQMYFDNVKTLKVRGPIIIDQSAATFNRPTGNQTIKWAWYVSTQNGRTCDIQGVTNQDGALGGVLIDNRAVGNKGFKNVTFRDAQGLEAPCTLCIRGHHRATLVDNIFHEDPTGIGTWAVDKAIPPVLITADASDVTDHSETVVVTNIFTKWGITGAVIDRAAAIAVRNVISDGYGYTYNGTTRADLNYNGGPVFKINNTFWNPDLHSAKVSSVSELITRNTNRIADKFIALVAGVAGDQDLTYTHCKFDAPVQIVGQVAPDRTGGHPGHGWTRYATIRNSTFYDHVYGLNNFATIENCKMFGPTVIDPTISTSQHDDVNVSFDQNVATMPLLLELGPNTSVTGCFFYGAKVQVDGNVDGSLLSNCVFLFGSFIDVTANALGTLEIKNPHNLKIEAATPTGSPQINIRNPTGTTTINGDDTFVDTYQPTVQAPPP